MPASRSKANVARAPAVRAASEIVALVVGAALTSSANANVSTAGRFLAAPELGSVSVRAGNAVRAATWASGLLRHWELDSAIVATLGTWRSARIAAASAVLAAREIVPELIQAANASLTDTNITAATRLLAANELVALTIGALHSIGWAGGRRELVLGLLILAALVRLGGTCIAATSVALSADEVSVQ